jgi:hypothetical protein
MQRKHYIFGIHFGGAGYFGGSKTQINCKVMKINLIVSVFFCLAAFGTLFSQSAVPRLFLDVPEIYVILPNVNKSESFNRSGLGTGITMNVASYHATGRVGGYFMGTTQPKADDLKAVTTMHYGGFVEGGTGLYRTNGNRCAKDARGAYTAMLVGGVRYDLSSKDLRNASDKYADGFDYTAGLEFGYFYIKDIIKNTEFTLRGDYYFKQELVGVRLGLKVFLNLKGER